MIIDSYGASSNYDGREFDEFIKSLPTEEKEEYDFQNDNKTNNKLKISIILSFFVA